MALGLEMQLGVAKIAKYAASESGDTFELIERPHGGLSAVLVDGQRSGRTARIISNIVARKAVSLLGEGVRDGAAARAAHDYLRTHRAGQVSAELQIVSVDLATRTLVISRNARSFAYLWRQGVLEVLDAPCDPIGIYPKTKPSIIEVPLEPWSGVLLHSDGLPLAFGEKIQGDPVAELLQEYLGQRLGAQPLADILLEAALQACSRRPKDDISIVIVTLQPDTARDGIRRLSAYLPI